MQCATDLVKLRDAIISRVRHLDQIVSPITAPLWPEERRALSFAVIELDNLIVVGLRQYTKSSLLRARTAAGHRITSTAKPASLEEAAALIFKSLNYQGYLKAKSPKTVPEKDEVAFRNPKDTETVLIDYSASNLPDLTLALSLNSPAFTEVKIFRHYFAHRARNTYERTQLFAANLAIHRAETPEHLILRGRPGTGVRFIDGWLADIETFFDLAT